MDLGSLYRRIRTWLWARPFRTAFIFCIIAFIVFQLDVRLTDPEYVARYSLSQQIGVFFIFVVPWAYLAAFFVWWGRRRAAAREAES